MWTIQNPRRVRERIHHGHPQCFTHTAALTPQPTDRLLSRACITDTSARNIIPKRHATLSSHRITADCCAVHVRIVAIEYTHTVNNACRRQYNESRMLLTQAYATLHCGVPPFEGSGPPPPRKSKHRPALELTCSGGDHEQRQKSHSSLKTCRHFFFVSCS